MDEQYVAWSLAKIFLEPFFAFPGALVITFKSLRKNKNVCCEILAQGVKFRFELFSFFIIQQRICYSLNIYVFFAKNRVYCLTKNPGLRI